MRFLGELAQARNDGIDIERASTHATWSFTSYHGQLLHYPLLFLNQHFIRIREKIPNGKV